MNKILFWSILTCSIFFSSICTSATFTISASNLPSPSGIEAFVVDLSVDGDFLLTAGSNNLGSLVPLSPSDAVLPWVWETPKDTSGGVFSISIYNADVLDIGMPPADGFYTQNNALSGAGTIGQFDHAGTILGIDSFRFTDGAGDPVPYSDLIVANFSADSANFSVVVPIPGSILLLGSGLVGLIGIARRKKN